MIPPEPESRFTGPTERCPNPGRWTSTDADSTECEVSELLHGLTRALQPDHVLETGTAFGETAEQIGSALCRNGRGTLWTLERDEERRALAAERLSFLRHSGGIHAVRIVGVTATEWKPPPGVEFDLCFFDSYWRYRVTEFEHFRPFMRAGTICCFHDTAPGHGGDRRIPGSDIRAMIVDGLRRKIRYINLPTPRGLLIGEVL